MNDDEQNIDNKNDFSEESNYKTTTVTATADKPIDAYFHLFY